MTERWKPMKSAPRDGTVVELRHRSRADGGLIFTARWLCSRQVWVDWERPQVALTKFYLKGWRCADHQPPAWTPEELALLTEMHGPPGETYLDATAFRLGIRQPVGTAHARGTSPC